MSEGDSPRIPLLQNLLRQPLTPPSQSELRSSRPRKSGAREKYSEILLKTHHDSQPPHAIVRGKPTGRAVFGRVLFSGHLLCLQHFLFCRGWTPGGALMETSRLTHAVNNAWGNRWQTRAFGGIGIEFHARGGREAVEKRRD